ncbi:hypothetical protein NHQ30_009813 [Ciborinia camelliae]|nr:hypothetical protein NHQ30_009813 [Ciborinia camelliae]
MHFAKITTAIVFVLASVSALALPQTGNTANEAEEEDIGDWNVNIQGTVSYIDKTAGLIQMDRLGSHANFIIETNETLTLMKFQDGINDQLDISRKIVMLNGLHDLIHGIINGIEAQLNNTLALSPTSSTFTFQVKVFIDALSVIFCNDYLPNVVKAWRILGENDLTPPGLEICPTFDSKTGTFS